MKIFLRENKWGLFLLVVPILCLIVIWNINIYKVWWDYFTPWKNFGSPPAKVEQILRVNFPHSPFQEARPIIYVYTFDRRVYVLDGRAQWRLGRNMLYFAEHDFNKEEKLACVDKIKQEWGLAEEDFQNAESVVAQGICSPNDSYQYAIYQIKPDGSIWEKYVNGVMLDHCRKSVSFWVKVATILYVLVWMGVFKKDNPFKTKPDYEAN
jgi:hypothetical protein